MAEDNKIVTKKTAAKPAATTKKAPTKAATEAAQAPLKAPPPRPSVGTKKVPAKAAAPRPAVAPPAPAPKPAAAPKPVIASPPPKAASPAPKAASPAPAKKTVTRRTATKKAVEASQPRFSPQPPLEEKPVNLQHLAKVSPEERLVMVRDAAYYKAERRNFAPGHEAEDWAEAEREIDELLAKARQIYGD